MLVARGACHWVPVRTTKKKAFMAARSGTRGLCPLQRVGRTLGQQRFHGPPKLIRHVPGVILIQPARQTLHA